jgi:hypothetical protein
LKILVTTFTCPPNADGCAEAAAVLAPGMARRGHTVTVVTEFHPERKPDAPDGNPRVEQFKITGNSNWRPGRDRRVSEILEKFFRRFGGFRELGHLVHSSGRAVFGGDQGEEGACKSWLGMQQGKHRTLLCRRNHSRIRL